MPWSASSELGRDRKRRLEIRKRGLQALQLVTEPPALGQNPRRAGLDRQRHGELGRRIVVVPQLPADHAAADDGLRVTGLKQQGAVEAFLGPHDLSKHNLDHAAIAECIGIVRLDLDCAFVQLDRLPVLTQMHQRVAEVGQRDRKIRL
ncbi:hypothetical protein ACVWWO_009599 [Bradyrhizobium sp. F1.13.1]